MKKLLSYKLFLLFLLLFVSARHASANSILYQADSLYQLQDYPEALRRYEQVLDRDQYLRNDFTINFKLGICYLKNDNYSEAKIIFTRLQQRSDQIPEYIDYFVFLSGMAIENTAWIVKKAGDFLANYSNHFFADSVMFHLAGYQFENGNYIAALRDYTRLFSKKSMRAKKPYLLARMAFCRLYLRQREAALELMYQVMKKYPGDPAALQVADQFRSDPAPAEKYEFAIADVYLNHGKFEQLTNRMENFIHRTKSAVGKEKARFYIIMIYYEKNAYRTALYGFNNILDGLQDKSLESRIRLSIARCYLRLDEKERSVVAYMDYANRYPRRRMAVECIWKANWIYEELGDLEHSLSVNQQLLKHWPRSIYRNEAKFRIGLINLRLGKYQAAENSFRNVRQSLPPTDFAYKRASYWLAKTCQLLGEEKRAEDIYFELGSEPLDGYYNLKSYMMYQAALDSIYQIKSRLADHKNPLRFHTHELVAIINQFEDLFLIRELLGDELAMQELSGKKYYPETLKGWIALAEVYKKLGAYNESYRIYDYIDKKHFADLSEMEKPYMLKESYPLYFNALAGHYGEMRNLDKNLVMALIRAESGFNPRAHSWADAYGLMQIIPPTAKALAGQLDKPLINPEGLYDPELNINLGTFYLSKLLSKFENKYEYAVAAYNAGEHRVARWEKFRDAGDLDFFVENIEYTQTRNYVRRVMMNYWIYRLLENVSQSY